MINIRLRVKETKRLDRLEREMPQRVGAALRDAAEAFKSDIRDNWSGNSPSAWGEAPAVVTGNLDSAISVEQTGRDVLGRFSRTPDAQAWFVRVDTAKGDNPMDRGDYATVLEDPAQLNRPFIDPAVKRMEGVYPFFFKSIFK